MWEAAVHLYTHYDEFDSACNCMMTHSPLAWSHETFINVMQKVANTELYYRAISFYLEEQPMQLSSLLTAIVTKVDHARVVSQLRESGNLPLVQPYLKQVQQHNIQQVNDALNDLYIEQEDFEALRKSLDDFDNIDQIILGCRVKCCLSVPGPFCLVFVTGDAVVMMPRVKTDCVQI